jgi:hypothetical protein
VVRLGLGRIVALYHWSASSYQHYWPTTSLTYSVPLFLSRQCDRTPGSAPPGGRARRVRRRRA